MSKAFQLLHPTVQRKLWDMKWTELRPIQVDAIEHLLGGTPTDCIISSPTASGKTEAAFLPVLSAIADEPSGGIRAMYIGPLKALINDQFGRIEDLCARMEMPVHRWHGDVDDGARKAVLASPAGVLLITPESLEAMFVLRPTQLPALFGRLAYVVIDETHAFLGTERGAQLISQLHRLRLRAGVDPIRVGLSATLGDRDAARRWLRRDGRPVRVIDAPSGSSEIKLRVRGFWRPQPSEELATDDADDPALVEVARSILLACHGKTNLVFANSKSLIEALADELANQAKASSITDDVVVHHGSLSKDQREHAEERLRSGRPCTAVCSNTLELGIDIGSIDEVVQVSPPWSVASLVQRLGRSGRRPGSARILRGFFIEDVPDAGDDVWERLHLSTIRGLASIELMLEHWLEAPEVDRANLSTAVQQLLSILAETGGIRAHELHPRLADSGAFPHLSRADLAKLLRELGARDLVEQLPDSTLVLGLKAQRIVEHYSFYAAFKSPSELQVLHRERSIGALPESMLPGIGEHVILAGRRWLVEDIDMDRRRVYVSPSRGRRPPRFASAPGDAAPTLHARMRAILLDDARTGYLDDVAFEIVGRAREAARDANIDRLVQVVPDRSTVSLWAGSKVHRTLWLLFASAGLRIESAADVALHVHAPIDDWSGVLRRFLDNPDASPLAMHAEDKLHARGTDGEKFDVFLPGELWRRSFVRERLDVENAVRVARRILSEVALLVAPASPPRLSATVVSIPDVERWTEAISAMPAPSPLPARTALVPSEAHAHALRTELATRAPRALAGTRFFTSAAAARVVLDAAGTAYTAGEEQRRPLRLRKLFRTRPSLTSYQIEDLGTPGWEEAFAFTIEQLEAAALRPEDLERLAEPRASDLAAIWRAVDIDAGSSWTIPRIMAEATARLRAHAFAWPFDGHTLAAVPVGVDTVHAQFLSAIPRLIVGTVPGRPARRRAVARVRALLGDEVASRIATVGAEPAETELGILAELLFEPPSRIASVDRKRSHGHDGSVSLELHAGVDEELDAMVRWVAEEVFEHRTPLQDIAVLVSTPDPQASLVADRIRAMSWPADIEPVYLACGRPAVATSAGARLLSVVNAIGAFLPADAMIELLPRLRLAGSYGHVTPGRGRTIAAMLGTLGGSPSRPNDALRWRDRLTRADLDESARMLAPAIDALVEVTGTAIAGASMCGCWDAIREFTASHVIGSREMSNLLVELGDQVTALAADPVTAGIAGVEAIEAIASVLASMRVREGRYGTPSIYVGPITGAAGLRFTAVRIVGLAEGAFPGTLREDPILPADMRRRLPAYAMPSDDDYATSRLHAFDQIVRGTRARLALSTPRMDLDGSEREPAALFVEAAAALGRPNALTGAPGRAIPTMSDLDRDAFRISRAQSGRRRAEVPLTASCWLRRVADTRGVLPSSWSRSVIVDPIEVVARSGRMDGVLGPEPLTVDTFGTSGELPLSASALRMLLTCPQRFLLERMMRMRPRSTGIDSYRIDPAAYGALFHGIAETFAQTHGEGFGARRGDLGRWLELADDVACGAFEAFLDGYPLVGAATIESERRRLRRDVRTLIEHDWNGGRPRRFVAAELTFGEDAPIPIPTSAGPLFVTGRIDRIDVEGDVTLVRDLKTGRARPREGEHADPEVDLDLQLAVYVAVARASASRWSIPDDIAAAYLYTDPLAMVRERAFMADRRAFRAAGQRWFDLAMSLVRDRLYVRTPSDDDCTRCAFRTVCGDRTAATADHLRDATGTLGAFRDLKA